MDRHAVLSEGGFDWDHAPAVVLVRLRGGLHSNGHLHRELGRTHP